MKKFYVHQVLALLLFAVSLGSLTSCKTEIQRKKITGTYQLTEYTVNGTDSLDFFRTYYGGSNCEELTFRFFGKEGNGDNFQRIDCNDWEMPGFLPGWYRFSEKENITILFPHELHTTQLFFPISGFWNMEKLKFKRIELETWNDGDLHRLVFEE